MGGIWEGWGLRRFWQVQKVTEAAAKYRRPDQHWRAAYSASDIFMARFPSSRCIEGSRHEQRLRISLVKLQKKYEVNQLKNVASKRNHNDVLSRGVPVSEASEPIRLLRPRRISRAFWLRPVFGVGGRDASINGMESSSKSGDFDLWDAKVNNLADCVF